jgi:hypothetical protein
MATKSDTPQNSPVTASDAIDAPVAPVDPSIEPTPVDDAPVVTATEKASQPSVEENIETDGANIAGVVDPATAIVFEVIEATDAHPELPR